MYECTQTHIHIYIKILAYIHINIYTYICIHIFTYTYMKKATCTSWQLAGAIKTTVDAWHMRLDCGHFTTHTAEPKPPAITCVRVRVCVCV